MAAFLALIPLRDWFYAILVGALVTSLVYERHEGAKHEVAALAASTKKLTEETAKKTADLQARATTAEQAYDKERNAIANLPPVQPVRLCVNAGSGSLVPQTTGKKSGDAGASAAAGNVQPLPAGNPERAGPDIGPLLNLLALRADEVSSTLREYQSRE